MQNEERQLQQQPATTMRTLRSEGFQAHGSIGNFEEFRRSSIHCFQVHPVSQVFVQRLLALISEPGTRHVFREPVRRKQIGKIKLAF